MKNITIIISSQNDLTEHKKYVQRTCGVLNTEVIHIENKKQYSLAEAYNIGLQKASNDIVVFVHDDVRFDTKNWGRKLLRAFSKNPEYGILGVAGTPKLVNGQWWFNRNDMRGIVNHVNNGVKYTSNYNNTPQNDEITPVVALDGVFIAVDKTKIKKPFDEEFMGFHFYDIPFTLSNHLSGVKVGVTTAVRITHLSVGEVNSEWYKSKDQFENKFNEHLPVNIKNETFENRKMKVLIGCLNFQNLTGSEMYVMELAIGLTQLNCEVHILSKIGKAFATRVTKYGVTVHDLNNPPFYWVGDGVTSLNTPNGQIKSEMGKLYPKGTPDFDMIIGNHTPITEHLMKLYPNIPMVNIIHSEIIDLENPVIADIVKKYIAIRPNIKNHLINSYDIDSDKINLIYNPFDTNRFKPNKIDSGTDKEVILFVGTMDYLRKETVLDLINLTSETNKELWLVGNDTMGYGTELANQHEQVKYFPPTSDIEEFYYKCDVTAGIMLGRTTIEGYLCGKPGWIYTVDKTGKILDKKLTEVPEDLTIFDKNNVIKQVKQTLIEAYNS